MNKKEYLNEILEFIPSASQTLSKNPSQFVRGVSPVTISRGEGVYLWDNEGEKYLDFILALGPMIFGYANKRIAGKVKEQIYKGTIFSLPSDREVELAKLLRKVVPCAEMSRFLMNGNDATSGAIRLARHVTNRDHVAKCGYHGSQDWSISTKIGRNNGVPEIIKSMTHDFIYNDITSLEKIFHDYPKQISAVILEPVSSEKPEEGFLEKVKEITHKNGALLIFDEMVTGFRWALGGAQEYFGVIPDIACFGKAISSGYPLATISGKAEYMKRMDEIFVSMTFGGYVPGLVAAIETIEMMIEYGDVHEHMHEIGEYLIDRGNDIFEKYNLPAKMVGYGPHPILKVSIADEYESLLFKSFIYQELNKSKIIFISSVLIGYLHTKDHIDLLLENLEKICQKLSKFDDYKKIVDSLEGDVIASRTVR
jgi:glutamate-1-semialdehyde aminotransferase